MLLCLGGTRRRTTAAKLAFFATRRQTLPTRSTSRDQNNSTATTTTIATFWEEEEEVPALIANDDNEIIEEQQRRRRPWLSWGPASLQQDETIVVRKNQQSLLEPPSHPLRNANWTMYVSWRRNRERRPLRLEFSECGYVREASNVTTTCAGTWELTPRGGLTWALPKDENVLIFHGDFHVNIYAPYARVTRGVVIATTTNNRWFRPVVATFRGMGNA
jgi:hypothetical protein